MYRDAGWFTFLPHGVQWGQDPETDEGEIDLKRLIALLMLLLLLLPAQGLLEEAAEKTPRQELIDLMLDTAKAEFDKARGRAMPAHSSGDIYVCKNFTVHMFRKNRDDFRMAEFPEVSLVIPDNLPRADSKPYAYGIAWKDIPASEGNPFSEAASFYYDTTLSKEENREKARAFMRQVQRGDFFQMSAKYYYGTGAHSLVFSADYDPDTDSVTWTDSNMKGKTVSGKRHGYIQWDAVKKIDWFVDAFCKRNLGATLYRLRDDIIHKP